LIIGIIKVPNRTVAQRTVEIDLIKEHFYDNDVVYASGGRLLDRVQFLGDKGSFAYERNGLSTGKRIYNQDTVNFSRMDYVFMNLAFLAVKPLLAETNIEENITLHQNKKSGTTTLSHKTSDGNVVIYEFGNAALQLISLNNKVQKTTSVYEDYQTVNDIAYARTVNKYYDGAAEPTFVVNIDQFNIIERIDPVKLQVPEGYGPEIAKSDGVLVSKEIAKDLYLVTDSSASRNSLFKVNGDEIMVFGASGYPSLSERTIKLINEQFPKKKITSVYVTHPHGYEIGGLKVYAELGIEILADDYSIAAIKAYPDFADDIAKFKFRTIEHEQTIDGAHFYVLENMHSKRQSFVHFKDNGIIFQADFLHVAFDNTIAKVILITPEPLLTLFEVSGLSSNELSATTKITIFL